MVSAPVEKVKGTSCSLIVLLELAATPVTDPNAAAKVLREASIRLTP